MNIEILLVCVYLFGLWAVLFYEYRNGDIFTGVVFGWAWPIIIVGFAAFFLLVVTPSKAFDALTKKGGN